MKTRWTVYHGDGSKTKGSGRPGAEVESRNVQAIVQDHPRIGVEIVTSCDYYVFDGGRWRGVDVFGLFDFLMDTGLVMFGRTLPTSEGYNAIVTEAMKEKNGWLPRERRS